MSTIKNGRKIVAPETIPDSSLSISPSQCIGLIEVVEASSIRGWAADLSTNQPASLILVMDGRPLGTFKSTHEREDVNAAGVPGRMPGFVLDLPPQVLDGYEHRLSIRFRNGPALKLMDGTDGGTGEFAFRLNPYVTTGTIDGLLGSSIFGWLYCTDLRNGRRSGRVDIEVRSGGIGIDRIQAASVRLDVTAAHGCDEQCGFVYTIPTRFRNGRPFLFEFIAIPDGRPLEGSPYSGQTIGQDTSDQLKKVLARVDAVCTESYALRDLLKTLTLKDEYSLDAYHQWAILYFNTIESRLATARRDPRYSKLFDKKGPKISVICPTYRPDLRDFTAAIDSVRRQTWIDWELIIVDDGSRSEELTTIIDNYCASDERIKSFPQHTNGGISNATNAAISEVTGDYVALFDHDDLLVNVALEVMALSARSTGALVLYSDEDKVDVFGTFSEPHLKPDWNYRLLLTNNYICHLLMVETVTLHAVGPLISSYDGAQDHDLVLRLSEAVKPQQIHHVPEILYHWRKAPGSTAAQQSSKSYAVAAGQTAVRDHLLRRGIRATVSAPHGTTLFDVRWPFDAEPKVTIIVPFKDQVHVTRRCIEALQVLTDYNNFRVVLIDNWSTESETLGWLAEVVRDKRVSVIRVEEAFNFSRVNNLAASRIETDLLLFLNNDVIVSRKDWLRLMVNELLADPAVAIVGCKLVYPNGLVQHAGVVLGVGGIADHAFRYITSDAPGYANRANVAQEWSAVTAACMLCRADVFHLVGMFDEDKLRVTYNDVDLCLKVRVAGYKVVYTPAVIAEHHESLSRGNDHAKEHSERFYAENQAMTDRWRTVIRRDPFYNRNFSLEDGIFSKLSSSPLIVQDAASLYAASPSAQPTLSSPALPQFIHTMPPRPVRNRLARLRHGQQSTLKAPT